MKIEAYDRELFRMAKENLEKAYAPYSGFFVSAMLVGKSGKVYSGVNIENASYPAGICAERTAMSKAISEGERDFDRIVIATKEGTGWPCGICRQFMFEFAPELKVVAGEDENTLECYSLSELLVRGFRLED